MQTHPTKTPTKGWKVTRTTHPSSMSPKKGPHFLLEMRSHDVERRIRYPLNHALNLGNTYCARSLCLIAILVLILDCAVAVAPLALHPNLPQQRCPLDERLLLGEAARDLQPSKIDSSIQKIEVVPCLFRIKVPFTKPGDVVKIVGSVDSIGSWRTDKALVLTTSKLDFPWYL
jgi:hypothetical protein